MITIKEGYRSAVIYMLLRLMAADGYRDRREFIYILKVANELGLTSEDIASLKEEDLLNDWKLPANEGERMIILYYLLFMMKTDGIVSPEEEILVKELGHTLGFRIDLVADLIQVIKSYEITNAPSEKLIEKIRTYLN
ncbi:MAG TPA: hypothetical protein VMZ69_09765 [Saprospiraceae bacterium]|nr:hypothetical protein [Saprospiraceae bacterium]